MTYHVMCRVSGGVTGTRELPLRDGDSTAPKVFATREDAEAEASSLSRWVNRRSETSVRFEYWAVPA